MVARNSNLKRLLAEKARQCQYLLYVHKSLRHLDKNVEHRYQKVISRGLTSDVVADFKRWLLG